MPLVDSSRTSFTRLSSDRATSRNLTHSAALWTPGRGRKETLIRLRARSTLTVAVIGVTQTLAWASSYYLPAILADPIAAGLGVPKSLFFGCFSGSLLLQAAPRPATGRPIAPPASPHV